MKTKDRNQYYNSVLYQLELIENQAQTSIVKILAHYFDIPVDAVKNDALASTSLNAFLERLEHSVNKYLIEKKRTLFRETNNTIDYLGDATKNKCNFKKEEFEAFLDGVTKLEF